MSSCQSSAREQYPKITRPMMKQLNTRSDGVDLPRINNKIERIYDQKGNLKSVLTDSQEQNYIVNTGANLTYQEI